MISLEALAAFLAFLCLLGAMLASTQSFSQKLDLAMEDFQEKAEAEEFAFLLDSAYNNAFASEADFNASPSLNVSMFLVNRQEIFDLPTQHIKVSRHYR